MEKGNLLKKLKNSKTDKYQDDSKERLRKILVKKMKTVMIGSLDRIEQKYGFLWGHNKKSYDRDEEEQEFAELWAELRSSILDLGNDQIKAVEKELETYTVNWDRYQMSFVAQEDGILRREE